MRLALVLALTLPLAAQSWDAVRASEGSPVFQVLHGQYLLDLQTLPTVSTLPSATLAPPATTVSFSPQGAEILKTMTGKRIKGVGIHELVICSSGTVQAGAVYQLAVSNGILPISPAQAGTLFRQTAARSVPAIMLAGAGYASLGIPVLGQAGVISMTSRLIVGILSGHALFDSFRGQVQAQLPDPTPLLTALLDPEAVLTLTGCKESKMITRFGKIVVSGTFPLGQR